MSLAIVHSRTAFGIDAPAVTVEVHLSRGLPGFSIVGLPEKAVKESKDRVRSALINTAFEFPIQHITVNLAPADLPKQSGRFDLPIALGILAASKQIPQSVLAEYEFAGELTLSGALLPIRGVLPMAMAMRKNNRQLLIPQDNAKETVLIDDVTVYAAQHLLEVTAHLLQKQLLMPIAKNDRRTVAHHYLDLCDVKGQLQARRALEVAAAGRHSVLLTGPPGTGKTMLASRLPGILPRMTDQEALDSAAIYSISRQQMPREHWYARPFRAPHHTASSAAIVGGGNPPQPGEISLAHHGVLFLDELPEFKRHVLESLREPLEAGVIRISRASYQSAFPAQFQLVAAMNPCPCGYYGDETGRCRCGNQQIAQYQTKVSGPLLDRIDLQVNVPSLPTLALFKQTDPAPESSLVVHQRVVAANERQQLRQHKMNAALSSGEISQHCVLTVEDQRFLESAITKLQLSARAYHRILRLARTIADLDVSTNIVKHHLEEALAYR